MCAMSLSLCMIIIGNYLYSIYNSFTKNHEIILHITTCLLSECIERKESIVIMNEILTFDTGMRF